MALNSDRLLNRLFDYPKDLSKRIRNFDLFHVCDHSYAQLVHVLPSELTGVYCHDLDTFACLLDTSRHWRPLWFRLMTRYILRGLQKAAIVFYSTESVRGRIEKYGLIDPCKLIYAPLGAAAEFSPIPGIFDRQIVQSTVGDKPFLLHVGSCSPRKRIDLLLEIFAIVRMKYRNLQLVQIGGNWTATQSRQIKQFGIADAAFQLRNVSRNTISAFYRHAACVLQPSEEEGFGLPVIEAISCGATVVASNIKALREVGAEAVIFCPFGNIAAWVQTVMNILHDPSYAPNLQDRLAQASRFSWNSHAQIIVTAYRRRFRQAHNLSDQPAGEICGSFS